MAELLELLDRGPMIALAVAAVLMIILVAVVYRLGRRISRLERRLAERGEGAEEASLRRIAELAAQAEGAAGVVSSRRALRPALIITGVVVVLAVAGGAVWTLALGGSDDQPQAKGQGNERPTTEGTDTSGATTTGTATSASAVPAEVPPVIDPSQYNIAVLNGTEIPGAAGDGVAPLLEAEGYTIPLLDDVSSDQKGMDTSVVMWNGDDNRQMAQRIATDLGVTRATELEGLLPENIADADAVVVVGLDLATRNLPDAATAGATGSG